MNKNRTFCSIVFLLLSVMAWMMVVSVRDESQTWDEGIHIGAGYSYWKTGDYRLNREHPPLGKLIASLPLLWLDLHLPVDHRSWQAADEVEFGRQLLYKNTVLGDTMLFRCRLMMVGLTLLFGACIAFWTRSYFGAPVAVAALALFCFEPTIIAHGRYTNTDLLIAFTSFLAATAWLAWLECGSWGRLLWAGMALGLAMASKFSWPFLLPVFLVIAIIRRTSFLRLIGGLAAVLAIGFMVVAAVYAPVANQLLLATKSYRMQHPETKLLWKTLEDLLPPNTATGDWLIAKSRQFGLQSHPYAEGVLMHASHNRVGHPAYLLGAVSTTGWWYYFPVAFAVKEPTGLLLGVVLALLAALLNWRAASENRNAQWLGVLMIAVYMAIAMSANINIGIRHILPVIPFIQILIAVQLWNRWPLALVACVVLVAGETAWRHPYYLPFFNVLAGGPEKGHLYLADSNLDWGQDYKRLSAWSVHNLGTSKVCGCLFNSVPVSYYKLSEAYVPRTNEFARREKMDCIAAVSVTPLVGLYVPAQELSWIREKTPIARIGYSINLYDLRKSAR